MKNTKNILSIELIPSYLDKHEFGKNKDQIKDIIAKMVILGMQDASIEPESESENPCEIVSTLT